MTLTGVVVLSICFLGPVMPPIIGMVVGTIYDMFKRKRESADVVARRRLGTPRPTGQPSAPQ